MADSPGSPLSSLPSDDFTEDIQLDEPGHTPEASTPQMPPSKRRRTGGIDTTSRVSLDDAPGSPTGSISSDSSGELPTSPATLAFLNAGPEDDYSGFARDQVTVCQWEGCDQGDMGNMDALVMHIHTKHIGARQKKYLCEWGDCARKGQTHASGYALKAHMRSHTKEKPFYCSLPECDRAFTRSDALTKHMRSVHETEAVRLADSIAKSQSFLSSSSSGPGKFPRLKLKFSQPPKESSSTDEPGEIDEITRQSDAVDAEFVSRALGFDEHELSLPLDYLFRLLRKQLTWAEQETERLNREWEVIMEGRRAAWKQKEAILEKVIHTELRAFNSALTAEDFAIGNGVSSVGGDSTITEESSLRTGDVVPGSGMSSHRGADMGPPPAMERMEA